MQTPLKNIYDERELAIKSVKFNLTPFFNYSMKIGFTIALGSLFRMFFTLTRKTIGKESIITGLPFFRNSFFLCPFLISIGLLIWTFIIFNSDGMRKQNLSIMKYFKKTRVAMFFTNCILMTIFFLIYNQLCLPLFNSHEFKLSGHIFAGLFSGGMLTNIETVCEMYDSQNIKKKLMQFTIKFCKFLLYHNLYVIFWTAWIFHPLRETVVTFVFGFVGVLILNCLEIDKLILSLFAKSQLEIRKAKNSIQ